MVGIAHHYHARFSFYPDGSYIVFNPNNQSEHFQQIMAEQQNPDAIQMFQSLSSPQSTEEREDVFRRTNELMATFMLKGSMLWAADIIATMDHLDLNSVRYRDNEDLFLKRIKNQGIVINIENAEHYNFHYISILNPDHQMLELWMAGKWLIY